MAGANVSEVCRVLRQKYNHPIGRSTVYNSMNDHPEVKAAFHEMEGVQWDICHYGAFQRAQMGNPRDQRHLMSLQVRREAARDARAARIAQLQSKLPGGDAPSDQPQQGSTADGEPLSLRDRIANLDDDELQELLTAVQVINGRRTTRENPGQSADRGTGA